MATPSLHPLLRYLRRLSGGMAGVDVEDGQLLRRFVAQRDENAFTAIVQRYGAMVWSLCVRRLGETPEAEDAFQATFLVLVRKAPSLSGPELLGPWLYGVANRTAMKIRGQRARRAAREKTLTEQIAETRPEQLWSDVRPILDEEVNRLPTKYRQVVLLCYLQGLSGEEAARRLGCAKGTIFSRLSRARDLLRRRLSKRGVGMPVGALAVVLTEQATARAMPSAILCASTIRTSLLLATGTKKATLSAPLAALVEGVIQSMFLSKVKLAAIVLLALGLVGSGAGFVAHRTGAEQPASRTSPVRTRPAAAADKAKTKEAEAKPKADKRTKTAEEKIVLRKAHAALAEKVYRAKFEGLTRTKRIGNTLVLITRNPEDVYIWSVRWLQARRELNPKHEDHVAALEAHLQRMKELKKVVEDLSKDLLTPIKVDEAEWYRLEAELWLAQAKASAKKPPK